MHIKSLRPAPIKHLVTRSIPQCSENVSHAGWSDTYIARRTDDMTGHGLDPFCCRHRATYDIDGKPYCTQHAGPIVLINLATITEEKT